MLTLQQPASCGSDMIPRHTYPGVVGSHAFWHPRTRTHIDTPSILNRARPSHVYGASFGFRIVPGIEGTALSHPQRSCSRFRS